MLSVAGNDCRPRLFLSEDTDPMGLMRFRVFPTQRITEEMVQQAYLSGMDRAAWPVRTSVEGGS